MIRRISPEIEVYYIRGIDPMQEAAANLLLVLVTLFPIVDPLFLR
jgi:hypothetical protein